MMDLYLEISTRVRENRIRICTLYTVQYSINLDKSDKMVLHFDFTTTIDAFFYFQIMYREITGVSVFVDY